MNIIKKYDFKVKSICLTAYKALLLLKYFIVMPLNKEQMSSILKEDSTIKNELSNESLRIILNSFKDLGCEFSRPVLSNGYKYKLLKNPFSLSLTSKEVDLINKIRKNYFEKDDLKTILDTNSLIDKICLTINDINTIENLQNHKPLGDISRELILDLQVYCKNKNTVIFEYLSGKKVSEFELQASFLRYEKGRLYIWGYSPKYNDYSYLRVDKIKSAKIIKLSKNNNEKAETIVRYKTSDLSYILSKNEVLVSKTDKELVIDYKIENKFYAIQKFLQMGDICEIISPLSFKKDFIKEVMSIKEVYQDV